MKRSGIAVNNQSQATVTFQETDDPQIGMPVVQVNSTGRNTPTEKMSPTIFLQDYTVIASAEA